MLFLLCLYFIICFKDVFPQITCYRCPTTPSLTKDYFLGHNCSFVDKSNSYICCVQESSLFKCADEVRKKWSDGSNIKFFLRTKPKSTSNNSFQFNSFLSSLQQNLFQQNQFLNRLNFAQQGSSQNQRNESNEESNNSLKQNQNNENISPINQNYAFLNFGALPTLKPNTQNSFLNIFNPPTSTTETNAEESFHSEFIPARKLETNNKYKQPPIKRSVNNSNENPITDIRKHKNFDLLPSKGKCGIPENADRIFGGEEAKIGEFRWMCLLEYSSNERNLGFKCGGILINNRYVLTAAHCIVGKTLASQENLIRVRLGEHNLNTKIDCDINGNCNNPPLDVEIDEIILHHGYNETNKNIYNDIALIRLNKKINFTEFVEPICLPLDETKAKPGNNMTISGWGFKDEEIPSYVKKTAVIPYVDNRQCQDFWKFAIDIIDSQFCAGGISRINACRGDSGGPIMSTFTQSGHWYVEGIVSFGKVPCGGNSFPSVYTRVSSYINWILDNIRV